MRGKVDPITASNGVPVGSAVTIVDFPLLLLPVVASAGVAVGVPAAPSTAGPDKTKTDDLAGVTLAYGARGPPGPTTALSNNVDVMPGV